MNGSFTWRMILVAVATIQAGMLAFVLWGLATASALPVRFVLVDNPKEEVCPGETIPVWVVVDVIHSQVIQITESWWSVDRQNTVVFDNEPIYSAYDQQTHVERTWPVTIPDELGPGRYELKIAVKGAGHTSAVASVPFTVLSCP